MSISVHKGSMLSKEIGGFGYLVKDSLLKSEKRAVEESGERILA